MPWRAVQAPHPANDRELIFEPNDGTEPINAGSGRFFLQSGGYSEVCVESAAMYLNANGLVPGQINTTPPGVVESLIYPADHPVMIGDTVIFRDGSMIVAGSPPNPNDWTAVALYFNAFATRQSVYFERWSSPPANPIPQIETQDAPRDRVVKIEFDNGMV